MMTWPRSSPGGAFAASFDNPDFVEIVLHSCRHRLGGVAGGPTCDAIEARLAAQPDIAGPCERRIIDGIGHNLPQEALNAFTSAVLELAERP
jgi:hypothetical protein